MDITKRREALERVAKAADKALSCWYEFAPEYPEACNENMDVLDGALSALGLGSAKYQPVDMRQNHIDDPRRQTPV
jgi:hypothetical protein